MYGMVNKAIEEMVVENHGEAIWERIKEKAGVDEEVFIASEGYPDSMTYSLVGAASEVLGLPADKILEAFGIHWIVNTAQKSYGDMMAAGGQSLREFLINLPQFHTRVSMIFPHLMPPEFECAEVKDRSLRLDYFSKREGLAPFVIGLLKGLGQLFQTPVTVTHLGQKSDGGKRNEFLVEW